MKLKVTNLSGETETLECKSFDFEGGFLKIIQPNERNAANELYLATSKILVIENFGPVRDSNKDKDSEKHK